MNEKKRSYIFNSTADIAEIIGLSIFTGGSVTIPLIFSFFKNTAVYIIEKTSDEKADRKKVQKVNQELFNIMLKTPELEEYETSQRHNYVNMTIKVFSNFDLSKYRNISLIDIKESISSDVNKEYDGILNRSIVTAIAFYSVCAVLSELTSDEATKIAIHTLYDIEKILNKSNIINYFTPNIEEIITQCSDSFKETLYLHKDKQTDYSNPNKIVNLNNLYVDPYIRNIRNSNTACIEALDFLESGFNSYNKPLIFLGDAGSGKTSLIYHLAHIYRDSKNTYRRDRIFNGCELVILKLRYIDKNSVGNGQLYRAICDELNVSWKDDSIFNGKFVILDGLDEITSYNSATDFEDIIKVLKDKFKYAYRFIITSRPGVVNFHTLDKDWDVYTIIPFDEEKKNEWIDKYEKASDTEIPHDIKQYILSAEDTSGKSIFDYPQLMYMIASATPNEEIWSLNNKWSIYHHIFYNEILERKYEDDYVQRPSEKIKESLYNLLQCIAYEMYKNDSITKIKKSEIELVIDRLNDSNISSHETMKTAFTKFGYRFGCYWNMDDNDLEIEFYHNNIRDFFIAEYLYNKLNTIFEDIIELEGFKNYSSYIEPINGYNRYEKISKNLYKLLKGVPIHKEVVDFLTLRTTFKNYNSEPEISYEEPFASFVENNVIQYKMVTEEDPPIKSFINELCINLNIYSDSDDSLPKYTAILCIRNFINNFISIIHSLAATLRGYYDLYVLSEPSDSKLFKSAYLGFENNRYINLSGSNLCHFELEKMQLTKAILSDANLNDTNLKESDISRANLDNAKLVSADLSYAKLSWSSLYATDFSSADLSNAFLWGANLNKTKFIESNLSKASLKDTKIRNAVFQEATLNNAEFLNSELTSVDFTGAHLEDTDFTEAHLENVDFTGAILINAKFKYCDLRNIIFDDADLMGADFTGANYNLDDLKKAKNLEYAKIGNHNLITDSIQQNRPSRLMDPHNRHMVPPA